MVALNLRLSVTALLLLAVACTPDGPRTFEDEQLSFRYPAGWHVTRFSTTNSPRRLAATSYPVPENAVEGDCGGLVAVRGLPDDGVYVILIDYGDSMREEFRPQPQPFSLTDGHFAEYECFGASTLFRFRAQGRDLQAHVGLGARVSDDARREALAILDSLVAGQPGG